MVSDFAADARSAVGSAMRCGGTVANFVWGAEISSDAVRRQASFDVSGIAKT
jgi:hypothetical protein